jgi:hypothetical protein
VNNANSLPALTPTNGLPAGRIVGRENELPALAEPAISVDPAKAELFSQLARRLVLLEKILDSLARSRDAIVGLDLDGIYSTVTEQQSLCGELRSLQTAMMKRPGTLGASGKRSTSTAVLSFTSAELDRVATLRREMVAAEGNLRRQARINSSLLRRCGRTNAALRSLYQSCLGTYAEPGIAGPATLKTEQR